MTPTKVNVRSSVRAGNGGDRADVNENYKVLLFSFKDGKEERSGSRRKKRKRRFAERGQRNVPDARWRT